MRLLKSYTVSPHRAPLFVHRILWRCIVILYSNREFYVHGLTRVKLGWCYIGVCTFWVRFPQTCLTAHRIPCFMDDLINIKTLPIRVIPTYIRVRHSFILRLGRLVKQLCFVRNKFLGPDIVLARR